MLCMVFLKIRTYDFNLEAYFEVHSFLFFALLNSSSKTTYIFVFYFPNLLFLILSFFHAYTKKTAYKLHSEEVRCFFIANIASLILVS